MVATPSTWSCGRASPFQFRMHLSDADAAPLLCAGAVGYRSLRLTGLSDGQKSGLTGFGASGHLVLKMARHLYPNSPVFVFARAEVERAFAGELGAAWAGDIGASPPDQLHGIIDTTPVWRPVIEALRNLKPGGRLVINAIRKEEVDRDYLLRLDYPAHCGWRIATNWKKRHQPREGQGVDPSIDSWLSIFRREGATE